MIRLFADSQYYIKDDQLAEWVVSNNIQFERERKKVMVVEDAAMAEDLSWKVIRGDSYVSSTGLDKALTDEITDFYSKQKERNEKREREIRECHDIRERAERERQEALGRSAREEEER